MKTKSLNLNQKNLLPCWLLLFIAVLMISKASYSQFECKIQEAEPKWGPAWACNPNINGEFQFYGNMDNYIPYFDANPLRNPPTKTLRLNINIYLKEDTTGNFPDNENTREIFRQIMIWVNHIYSVCPPSNLVNGVQEKNHSYVQFDIGNYGNERIFFYYSDFLWQQIGSSNLQNAVESADPSRMENINLHITGGSTPNWAHASGTSWTNFDFNQWVIMFYPGQHNTPIYANANTLAHELGHLFGLHHTYCGGGSTVICCNNIEPCYLGCNINYSNTEYLSDIFGVSPNGNCPHLCAFVDPHDTTLSNHEKYTNNLMGGTIENCYISPKQSGQIHRALALSAVRGYVNDAKSNVPLTITNNQTWDFNFRIYRDININNNSTLTLQCSLYMPEFSNIIVNTGCTLVIDDDALLTGFNNNWQGTIHIKENAVLIIKNGGTIRMSGNGNILIDYANGAAGKLSYYNGAQVILSDYTTKLEIKGNLQLMDGAQFSTQGLGFVRFSNPLVDGLCYNIIAGANTSMSFVGLNQNHKKLEIAQFSLYTHGVNGVNAVKYISFANCKVVMSGYDSRLSLYYASGGSIYLNNVTITSSTGNRTGHRGIAFYG